MAKYRKKPVVIEAIQLKFLSDKPPEVTPQWLSKACMDGTVNLFTDGHAEVSTLEGTMHASPGDWIIQGVKGEIYPCKPDIFAATYDAVDG